MSARTSTGAVEQLLAARSSPVVDVGDRHDMLRCCCQPFISFPSPWGNVISFQFDSAFRVASCKLNDFAVTSQHIHCPVQYNPSHRNDSSRCLLRNQGSCILLARLPNKALHHVVKSQNLISILSGTFARVHHLLAHPILGPTVSLPLSVRLEIGRRKSSVSLWIETRKQSRSRRRKGKGKEGEG
jgi:hypothetical protein